MEKIKIDGLYDLNNLIEMIGEDEDFIKVTIQMFVNEDCPTLMSDLKNAVLQKEALLIKQHAHKLAGSVANFGAEKVFLLAKEIEACGRDNELSKVDELFEKLSKELLTLNKAFLSI